MRSNPEFAVRTETHTATSAERTVSLDEMTAPDKPATGRRRDPSWGAMHLALPQPARRVVAMDEVTVTGEGLNGRTA